MTFELLISTMHKKNMNEIRDMLKSMNVNCNCIVVNQCDEDNELSEIIDDRRIKAIFTKERGLSRSRNMALKNAEADIVGIADDDLYYYDDFDKTIINYYENNKNADIVMFGIDSYRKQTGTKEQKCKFMNLGSYISIQTSLRRNSVKKKNISFNVLFGTGSRVYDSGEENIFLADCYRAGLKLFYCPEKILKHEETKSSWFNGYNKKFITDRGAIYTAVYKNFAILYIIRFAFLYKNLYKPISTWGALQLMLTESKKYKKVLKEDR